MPFHIEIRQSFQRAWAFNLEEEELRTTILDPWRSGRQVALGGRRWDPSEGRLRVLEGPRLAPADLAHGRGWHHAERSARDMTAAAIRARPAAPTAIAVLAGTPATREAAAWALGQLGLVPVAWGPVRSRILAGDPAAPPGVAGALLFSDGAAPAPSWLLDAGLAIGALGRRAVIAVLGDDPLAPALSELGALRLEPGRPGALRALGARLGAG